MCSSVFIYNSIDYEQEYDKYTDYELIEKINMGNDQAVKCILKRYFYLIKRIISSFYLIGHGTDDILQESMIGLLKAIKSYDCKYNKKFKTYAELCIRREIISTIRKQKSQKAMGNIMYIDGENDFIVENLIDNTLNPENVLIFEEEINNFIEFSSLHLSKYEMSVTTEYFKGKTYKEIAKSLDKDLKSIDNALQRIKKKLSNKIFILNKSG